MMARVSSAIVSKVGSMIMHTAYRRVMRQDMVKVLEMVI
jgi:hypothetical protein